LQLAVVIVSLLLINVNADTREDYYASCVQCIQNGKTWGVDALCTPTCFDSLVGWKKEFYRDVVSEVSQCNSLKYCTFVDNVTDGSFENNKWKTISSAGHETPLCTVKCSTGGSNPPEPAEGNYFIWFGGLDNGPYYQGVQSPSLVIPKGTTHMSLFIASIVEEISTAKLVVGIDDKMLLYIDSEVFPQFGTYYKNVDVDVRDFADDAEHTIDIKFYMEESRDVSAVLLDFLRFIKDNNLKGNSNNIIWPSYSFCGGGCRTDLLDDAKCHEQCNILLCNYDNSKCEHLSSKKCYNYQAPISLPKEEVCSEYYGSSCCTNSYDLSVIRKRLRSYKTSGCQISDHCAANIEKAVCAYCSPDNNKFIRNGTIYFSKSFQDALYASCKDSHILVGGTCKQVQSFYGSDAFISLFGDVTEDSEHCFSSIAYDPTQETIIIICCCCRRWINCYCRYYSNNCLYSFIIQE